MPYFKYAFLNCLRDELYLTYTFQKATLFHFLPLAALSGGLLAGILVGTSAHSWAMGLIVGISGCALAILAAWLVPWLLWKMLYLFVQKGWFLLPERKEDEGRPAWPVMTLVEFNARSKAFNRWESRGVLVFMVVVVVIALGILRFMSCLESANVSEQTQGLVSIGILSGLISLYVWAGRRASQRVKRLGLLCPVCGRMITDAAGLVRAPWLGRCKHCGAKIVSVPDQDNAT
jgi:hypothetical protein